MISSQTTLNIFFNFTKGTNLTIGTVLQKLNDQVTDKYRLRKLNILTLFF